MSAQPKTYSTFALEGAPFLRRGDCCGGERFRAFKNETADERFDVSRDAFVRRITFADFRQQLALAAGVFDKRLRLDKVHSVQPSAQCRILK